MNVHVRNNGYKTIVRRVTEVDSDQEETCGISMLDRGTTPWQRTILLGDKAVQLSTAKGYVFSDSVLCLGHFHAYPEIHKRMERKGSMVHNITSIS